MAMIAQAFPGGEGKRWFNPLLAFSGYAHGSIMPGGSHEHRSGQPCRQ